MSILIQTTSLVKQYILGFYNKYEKFIFGLCNDAVSISDYIASND
jgi:hypothetical protein